MREYETIYILKPDLPSDQVNNVKEKAQNTLKKGQGHVLTLTDWGKRRLAYQVGKFRHAQYIYLRFVGLGQDLSELERILKNDDRVLKFLSVKLADDVQLEERLAQAQAAEAPAAPQEYFNAPSSYSSDHRGSYHRDSHRGPGSGDGYEPEGIPESDDLNA